MANLYLATLGQRPAAITVALDWLSDHYRFEGAAILHTDSQNSGIAEAYQALQGVFAQDYPNLPVQWVELHGSNGRAILDIEHQADADDYYYAILETLAKYKRDHHTLHLMVSGGRKAMSTYAVLAAALLFGSQDRVWIVNSPPIMLNDTELFHIPPGQRQRVQLVQLPLLPARIIPSSLPSDIHRYLEARRDLRSTFFRRLSQAEQALAEAFTQNPYSANEQLAAILGKEKRTVDNQFASIYDKLTLFLDLDDLINDKRAVLRDLLLGRF